MHYEWMGLPSSPHIDALQFHVSSSKKKAEEYIYGSGVDAHSWWQIHPHVLDAKGEEAIAEGQEVSYYSHRGTSLKSAPHTRTFKAYEKHTARYPEFYGSTPSKAD